MEEERSSSGLDINFAVILHNFINAAKRLIWIALILALAVGAFRYYRLDSSYQPVYSSSVVFSVQASYASTTDIGTRSNWLDSSAAMAVIFIPTSISMVAWSTISPRLPSENRRLRA